MFDSQYALQNNSGSLIVSLPSVNVTCSDLSCRSFFFSSSSPSSCTDQQSVPPSSHSSTLISSSTLSSISLHSPPLISSCLSSSTSCQSPSSILSTSSSPVNPEFLCDLIVSDSDLNSEQVAQLQNLLLKYRTCFNEKTGRTSLT
ncbi:unnamed protein product, partial [Rotaria magnacalcarata]